MISVKTLALLLSTISMCAITSASNLNDTMPSVSELCYLAMGSSILRPDTCNRWIKCPSTPEGNDYEEGSCVTGLYYDKDRVKCRPEAEISCPYEATQKARCSNQQDGVYLADPSSCNGYIFCQFGRETHAKCPGDLVFHPTKSACVYRQEYNCSVASEASYVSPICRSLPNNTLIADDDDCSLYHRCVGGTLRTFTCGKGKAYDYVNRTCVNLNSVTCYPTALKPEPESTMCENTDGSAYIGYLNVNASCSSYYICTKQANGTPDRHPKLLHCDKGYFFDANFLSCRDRVNVKCAANRCEGMGNKYVNVLGDCTAYARCKNNETIGYGSCPDNYYFDERTQGCTAVKVNYAACSK